MSKGKYIAVGLTPDPELNREALGDAIVGEIRDLEAKLGCKLKLSNLSVKQGSEAARRVQRAHDKFRDREKTR